MTKSIQTWIRNGVLRVGDRVPAERELAERLGASRVTVRTVLKQLEKDGLISATGNGARYVAQAGSDPITSISEVVVIVGEPIQPYQLLDFARPTGWHMSIQVGAMSAVHAAGKGVLILMPGYLADPLAVERLVSDKPLGLIYIEHHATEDSRMREFEGFVHAGVPVVAYGFQDEFPLGNTVASDQDAGGYILTQWLISQGRRNIAVVEPPESAEAWYRNRLEGHKRALKEAGLAFRRPFPIGPHSSTEKWDPRTSARIAAGYLAEHLLGADSPDAIMAPSDGPATTVVAALRLLGRRTENDILVTGYDNYWEALPPEQQEALPAATVDKLNSEAGRVMAEILFSSVGGASIEHRLIKPELRLIQASSVTASRRP